MDYILCTDNFSGISNINPIFHLFLMYSGGRKKLEMKKLIGFSTNVSSACLRYFKDLFINITNTT